LFSSVEEVRGFQPQVSCRILVDGLALRGFIYPHTGIVRGDARSLGVAMASIVAKVTRDRMMERLETQYPGLRVCPAQGVRDRTSTARAIIRLGRCPIHREMFLRKLLRGRVDPAQLGLFDG